MYLKRYLRKGGNYRFLRSTDKSVWGFKTKISYFTRNYRKYHSRGSYNPLLLLIFLVRENF